MGIWIIERFIGRTDQLGILDDGEVIRVPATGGSRGVRRGAPRSWILCAPRAHTPSSAVPIMGPARICFICLVCVLSGFC